MRKAKYKKLIYTILFEIIGAAIITVLMMLYQSSWKVLSLVNAMQVAGAILFVGGWFVFVNHHGVFDIVTYGLQSFFRSFSGKPMEKTLFDRRMERKKMPAYLFISLWVLGGLIVGVSFIIYYMYI